MRIYKDIATNKQRHQILQANLKRQEEEHPIDMWKILRLGDDLDADDCDYDDDFARYQKMADELDINIIYQLGSTTIDEFLSFEMTESPTTGVYCFYNKATAQHFDIVLMLSANTNEWVPMIEWMWYANGETYTCSSIEHALELCRKHPQPEYVGTPEKGVDTVGVNVVNDR